ISKLVERLVMRPHHSSIETQWKSRRRKTAQPKKHRGGKPCPSKQPNVTSVAVPCRQHRCQRHGRFLADRPRRDRLALSREFGGVRGKALEYRRLCRLLEKLGRAGTRVLVLDWRTGRIRGRRGSHSRGRYPIRRAALRAVSDRCDGIGASLLGVSARSG